MNRHARFQRGVAAVEMAIVLPMFLLLLLAILDFGRLFFTEITLQHAMREAGRFGVTGGQLADPTDPKTLQSRMASIKRIVTEKAVGVEVHPSDVVVSSRIGGKDNAGGGGDTMTISLSYTFYFITPLIGQYFDNGSHHFTVSTSFRNEPFPPGASS